jgi:hypothetical protein
MALTRALCEYSLLECHSSSKKELAYLQDTCYVLALSDGGLSSKSFTGIKQFYKLKLVSRKYAICRASFIQAYRKSKFGCFKELSRSSIMASLLTSLFVHPTVRQEHFQNGSA